MQLKPVQMVERERSFQRTDRLNIYPPSRLPRPLQIHQVDCPTVHRLPTDRRTYPKNLVQRDLPIRH